MKKRIISSPRLKRRLRESLVEDDNNRGPTEVFNDVVKGILECRHNSRITGGLDFAKRKQGQCARF